MIIHALQGAAAGSMADIIGLSCRFPESNSPAEFWNNLMTGKDMLTADDRRWPVGFQGLPPRTGKSPGFDKFDAAFFSVHGKQAQVCFIADCIKLVPGSACRLWGQAKLYDIRVH